MIRTILTAAAIAASVSAASAATRPIVVELFTSQGCSSCPPADALLEELATRPNILALGFHVDYWDRLGWKDPLSGEGSTERQRAYARQFHTGEVYTPQMVVNGTREAVGSDRGAVLSALGSATTDAAVTVTFAADAKSVEIGAGSGAGRIILANFVLKRSNPIGRGENAGHVATDVNGVKTLRTLGDWNVAATRFDIDAPGPNEGVAVLIQSDDGKVLGAGAIEIPG